MKFPLSLYLFYCNILWAGVLLFSCCSDTTPLLVTAFSFPPLAVFSTATVSASETSISLAGIIGPQKVAVTGATGRTGRLVVQELLERDVNVVALVRDLDKAKETLPLDDDNLSVIKCDLSNEDDIRNGER